MQILFQFVKLKHSDRLATQASEKLSKINSRYQDITRADVFFKKENTPGTDGHVCDIRLSLPGTQIHATSNENSFEEAINETVRDLEDQLKKRKAKLSV